MKSINYVDEFNLFMRYARNYQLTGRERLLWIALFTIANDRAIYNAQTRTYEWPSDFFPVPNNELSLHSTLDKRGIETVRNKLKQRGLIDFHQGSRNARPAEYQIHYLSLNVGYKIVPNDVPNTVPNNVPNIVPNNVPNIVPNNAPLYIDINNIQNRYDSSFISGGAGVNAGARDASEKELASIGLKPGEFFSVTPERVEWVLSITEALFDKYRHCAPEPWDCRKVFIHCCTPENAALLEYAFETAAIAGKADDWRYIDGIMARLRARDIHTPEQPRQWDEDMPDIDEGA